MNSTKLVEWLITEKQMSVRSAKDVLSRYKRVCNLLDSDSLDDTSLRVLLKNERFEECSMFVKSQLKRTVILYLEFLNRKEKR